MSPYEDPVRPMDPDLRGISRHSYGEDEATTEEADDRTSFATRQDQMGKALAMLSEVVMGLQDRLEPVLLPERPQPKPDNGAAKAQAERMTSQLGLTHETQLGGVLRIVEKLAVLRERVDL